MALNHCPSPRSDRDPPRSGSAPSPHPSAKRHGAGQSCRHPSGPECRPRLPAAPRKPPAIQLRAMASRRRKPLRPGTLLTRAGVRQPPDEPVAQQSAKASSRVASRSANRLGDPPNPSFRPATRDSTSPADASLNRWPPLRAGASSLRPRAAPCARPARRTSPRGHCARRCPPAKPRSAPAGPAE